MSLSKPSLATLFLLLSATTAGCVRANTVRLGPVDRTYARIPWEQVAVYATASDVRGEYVKVGLIHAKGPSDWTRESGMVKRMRQEAGRIGANAIVLENIDEPSAGEKVAASVFWMSAERTGVASAIRLLDAAPARPTPRDAPEPARASPPVRGEPERASSPPPLPEDPVVRQAPRVEPSVPEVERRWGDRYWSDPRASTSRLALDARWSRVAEWEGDGSRLTESFEVPAGTWRLAWRTWGEGSLVVEVYELPQNVVAARVNQADETTTSYLQLDQGGTFYLRIEPRGVAWRVAVEHGR